MVEANKFTLRWGEEDFDLETSTRVIIAPNGEVVAYADVHDTQNPPISPKIGGCVHPDYEGKGLGTALMNWAVDRAKQAIPRCPDDARVAARLSRRGEHTAADALFKSFGFEVTRQWWTMIIRRQANPPVPQAPVGITIRPMHYPDELVQVVRVEDGSFRDHYGYVEHPIEEVLAQWQQWIENDTAFDPALWFVAVDDASQELAGFCICRHTINNLPDRALVNALGVLPEYRKRGLGMALLQTGFNALWERDKQEVILGVDATSLTGATGLYQKAGMSIHRTDFTYEKELRPGKEIRRIS